jgi:hypothetical protein
MPQWLIVRAHEHHHGDDVDAMCKAFRGPGVAMQRRIDMLWRPIKNLASKSHVSGSLISV